MRALLTSLTIVTALSASSFAFAASTATGTVQDFNAKAMTLTLKDGSTYMLPANFKNPGLKAGEKVTIAYDVIGKKNEASTVSIVK